MHRSAWKEIYSDDTQNPGSGALPVTSVGFGISVTALTYSGSGLSPSPVIKWPMKGTLVFQSLTLASFSLIFLSLHLSSSALKFWSWSDVASSRVSPSSNNRMS